MKVTNIFNLPDALVKACDIEPHNKPGEVSITTLLNGTKQIILTKRHWDEIESDVSDRLFALFGKVAHKLLEHETETSFSEERLEARVGEYLVTGRMDLYDMKTAMIDDWKTASVWKVIFKSFDDWKKQGIGYGWLLNCNGLPINGATFTAILKDHKKTDAKRDATYPQKAVYQYSFPITSSDIYDFERFVTAKVAEIVAAEKMADDDIAPCTAEERWAKPTKYAVMKTGRKTAVKVCETEAEANTVAADAGGFVQVRPGVSTRCEDYCDVCEFCNFYKSLKSAEVSEEV